MKLHLFQVSYKKDDLSIYDSFIRNLDKAIKFLNSASKFVYLSIKSFLISLLLFKCMNYQCGLKRSNAVADRAEANEGPGEGAERPQEAICRKFCPLVGILEK